MSAIPWFWLKKTPIGSHGIIPGIGMRFYHLQPTTVSGRGIFVDNGKEWIAIQPTKKGWTKPAFLNMESDGSDRDKFMARCPTHVDDKG